TRSFGSSVLRLGTAPPPIIVPPIWPPPCAAFGAWPGRVASLRYASRSARCRASFMPANVMVFPGMKGCGCLIHSSGVSWVRVVGSFVERVVGPEDAGRFERGGIAREARQRSGPSVPDFRQARAGHVAVGLERMAGNAGTVHAFAARGIARLGHCSASGQQE